MILLSNMHVCEFPAVGGSVTLPNTSCVGLTVKKHLLAYNHKTTYV